MMKKIDIGRLIARANSLEMDMRKMAADLITAEQEFCRHAEIPPVVDDLRKCADALAAHNYPVVPA